MTMQEAANRSSPDDRPGWYYVTIRDGPRHGLLAGPFKDDHPAALAMVDQVRKIAQAVNSRAVFAAFGTSWSPVDQGPGRLHDGTGWTDTVRELAATWKDERLAGLLARYTEQAPT
jgi:hypothetical protein